jgi:hypothetical protein
MSPSLEQLKATLAGLSVAERAELAQYLLRSLEPGDEGVRVEARTGEFAGIPAEAVQEIPPGILRSMQAFWRERPDLLKSRRNHGKWVAYHEDERLGIARDDMTLLREIARRSIPGDAYYITTLKVNDLPPWEAEEIEPIGPWHFDDPEDES